MNPIPLSSPSGEIYVYACGRCHHVRASSSRLVALPGPDDYLRERSLQDAERCCFCPRCDQPYDDDRRFGDCQQCTAWTVFEHTWAAIWTCHREGFKTPADYDRYCWKLYRDEHDDLE